MNGVRFWVRADRFTTGWQIQQGEQGQADTPAKKLS